MEQVTFSGDPPLDTPIWFLAGEFGCTPHWYLGRAWQSSLPDHPVKFYIYPWFLGFSPANPPFNSPPYLGRWGHPQENLLHYIQSLEPKEKTHANE